MIQDIAPLRYDVTFAAPAAEAEDTVLAYRYDKVLLAEGEALEFPRLRDFPQPPNCRYLFALDNRRFFLSLRPPQAPPGFTWQKCEAFRERGPQALAFAGITGASLARWYRTHRFCGCCGRQLRPSETERALVCDSCRITIYPHISPAVIVAVTRGDELLLTRYAGRSYRRWALIAGFCESGEPVEDTVRREVQEEVGLEVSNLRYYKSQPWGFSDSLLMGFYCDVQPGQEATPDGVELDEAVWFHRHALPVDDRLPISLTQEMIETFRQGIEPR